MICPDENDYVDLLDYFMYSKNFVLGSYENEARSLSMD